MLPSVTTWSRFALAFCALLLSAVSHSFSATVPAGTILIVRTMNAISSVDAPGTPFQTQLEQSVAIDGKVVLPAGTKIAGRIVTARRTVSSNQRLTVDLTAVQIGGRKVPLTTTGAQFLSNDIKTLRGTSVSRANYTVASGKLMRFQLARPMTL